MLDFDKAHDLKVLVVGDAIMDEYRYVVPIGKSIKDNAISTRYERTERFHGGVWAAAQHTASLCRKVDVWYGSQAMWNIRYVEDTNYRKLFTVHELKTSDIPADIGDISSYDLVIVTDFGHGTMTEKMIEWVTKGAKFLAVNAQTNSSNFGFNLITKYPRADYLVLDELEARLAVHDNQAKIEDIIKKLQFPKVVVTLGSNGAIGYDGGEFCREQARTNQVIDTMGAGDAFLCVSAPFAATGHGIAELVRVGNAAGAIKVGIVGHRRAITRKELEACVL